MARILVIDSSEGSLLDCLQKNPDWELGRATSVAEFGQRLLDHKIDLIIINETFAEEEVVELLACGERYAPDLPMLLITCTQDENSTIHSLQLGAVSFVPASASSQELCQVIHRLLALSKFSRAQQQILTQCESCQFRFCLSNQRDQIPGIVSYLRDVLASITGVGYREQMRVAVAIEEALQNAIVHGNLEVCSDLRENDDDQFCQLLKERLQQQPYSQRQVHLQADFTRQSVQFRIADEGPGFDLSKLPDPTSPEHLLQPHGRGLLLMKTFMDELEYLKPGNVLLMKKTFSQ